MTTISIESDEYVCPSSSCMFLLLPYFMLRLIVWSSLILVLHTEQKRCMCNSSLSMSSSIVTYVRHRPKSVSIILVYVGASDVRRNAISGPCRFSCMHPFFPLDSLQNAIHGLFSSYFGFDTQKPTAAIARCSRNSMYKLTTRGDITSSFEDVHRCWRNCQQDK